MTDTEKAEVVRTPSALAVPDEALTNEYVEKMKSLVETDPQAIQDDMVRRILEAETAEDVLAPQAVEHARDLVGVPMTIHRAKVNESDYEGGPGVYAIIEAELHDDGRTTTFSCGAQKVLAQVYRLAQLRAIPVDCVLKESPKPSKNGYKALWLETLGPRDKVTAELEKGRPAAANR
jgi:hypothetical protein